MKRTYYFLVPIILWSLFITSCSPVYVPNVVNVPLHNNQGEFQAAFHAGVSGMDFQTSYAIHDNFGIMVNAGRFNATVNNDDEVNRWFAESGAGVSLRLSQSVRFETYGGMGLGRYQGQRSNGLMFPDQKANLTRVFIQPSIGVSTEVFDGAFTIRSVYSVVRQQNNIEGGLFLEPVLTAKAGYRFIKGVVQFGFSWPVNENNFKYHFSPFLMSVGLQATLFRDWN